MIPQQQTVTPLPSLSTLPPPGKKASSPSSYISSALALPSLMYTGP